MSTEIWNLFSLDHLLIYLLKREFKSSLFSLIPFRVSRVSGAQLPIPIALRHVPHFKVAAETRHWQRV